MKAAVDALQPAIVEVRLNEWSLRQRNPHVPWTPREIAEDAHACWLAGASIVHFHVRNDDGSPAHEVALYAEAIREIRARCDILVHPTMAGVVTPEAQARMAPLRSLCADPATRPDFAPLDMGSTNLDRFDAAQRWFTTDAKTYVNSVGMLRQLAGEVQQLGLKELMCIWTVPCLRTVDAFVEAGLIRDDPAFLCLVLTEGGILGGHPGTLDGLHSLLRFLPPRRLAWSVCCREGNLMPVAEAALALGGHVSIGLGDYHYAELGCPTNAALVSAVAGMARSQGRAPATVAQVRAMLAMSTPDRSPLRQAVHCPD